MDCVFFNKCKERLNRIADSTFHANQVFSVFMQMRSFQEKHNELINISPGFYRCVISCCIEVLFVEINKMFDPNPSSDGVRGLLSTMQENLYLLDRKKAIEANYAENYDGDKWDVHGYKNIEQLVEEANKSISELHETIYRVKTQRDQYYAHQDERVKDLDAFFIDNAVSITDLETLIKLNVNLYNALNMYFNDSTLMPVATNHDDFKKTVFYIEKGVESIRELEG